MFKQYLRIFPKGLQLSVFLSLWAAMMLMLQFAMPIIIKSYTGLNDEQLTQFFNNGFAEFADFKLTLNVIGVLFSFALPAILFAYLAHPKPFQYLGFISVNNKKQIGIVAILAVALMFIVGIAGSWLQKIDLGIMASELQEDRKAYIDAYFMDFSALSFFRNLIFIAFVPALTEEIFFRGIIQKFAYSYVNRPGLAIIISSFFFTLIHFSIYEAVPIFWAGIVLGWVYYMTSSLWLNILLHFLHNALQVCWVFFAQKNTDLQKVDDGNMVSIVVFAASAIVFIIAMRLLNKNKTPLPDDWSVVEEIYDKTRNDKESD